MVTIVSVRSTCPVQRRPYPLPWNTTATLAAATNAQYLYDYADQDPINNYDLNGMGVWSTVTSIGEALKEYFGVAGHAAAKYGPTILIVGAGGVCIVSTGGACTFLSASAFLAVTGQNMYSSGMFSHKKKQWARFAKSEGIALLMFVGAKGVDELSISRYTDPSSAFLGRLYGNLFFGGADLGIRFAH